MKTVVRVYSPRRTQDFLSVLFCIFYNYMRDRAYLHDCGSLMTRRNVSLCLTIIGSNSDTVVFLYDTHVNYIIIRERKNALGLPSRGL